jgi:hypothetical protein
LDHARGRDLVGGDAVQRGYADRGASARAEVDRIQTGQVESMFFKELRERGEALSDALVAKALKAYASGRLLLIVNGRQVTGLDADIDLSVPIEALFLRLRHVVSNLWARGHVRSGNAVPGTASQRGGGAGGGAGPRLPRV